MSITSIIVIVVAFGLIVSGLLLLLKSAKKFKLTEKELLKIKQRNERLDKEED